MGDTNAVDLESVVEQNIGNRIETEVPSQDPITSTEQHEALVYLLGVYARNYEPKASKRTELSRTIKDRRRAATFEDAVFKLTGKRVEKKSDQYRVHSTSLVEKLRKTVEQEFDITVKTRKDYQLFLQGIFDVSEATLYRRKNDRLQYQLPIFGEDNARRVLVSLFKLDIFPYTDGHQIVINGPYNLRQVYTLRLDKKQKNKGILKQWLQGQEEYSLEQYYTGRRLVTEAFERGEKRFLQRIGTEVGVTPNVFYEWVCDIAQEHGQLASITQRKPRIVTRYEELRILLNMPNKYTGEGKPREEKKSESPYPVIVLHSGNNKYILTPKAQQDYFLLGGDEGRTKMNAEDIFFLEKELGKEADDTTRDLTFKKIGDRIEGIAYNGNIKDASIGEVDRFVDGIPGKGIGVHPLLLDMF